MEDCRLNDTAHPHEIDTEHFVGRLLVRVIDAPGAQVGDPGREYFEGRSRKFCIQIEGRFKSRLNGNDVLFGTDFDHFVDFPKAPFNAGMKVAKYIDPCTFYEFHPPSGRPYIMSPYVACMNTFCAWPAPSRAYDAVVVLRHTHRSNSPESSRPPTPLIDPEKSNNNPHNALVTSPVAAAAEEEEEEEEEDVVPRESLKPHADGQSSASSSAALKKKKGWFSGFGSGSQAKEERVLRKYWRFVGFKDEPRVRALLEAHHAKLRSGRDHADDTSSIASPSALSPESHAMSRTGSVRSTDMQHGAGSHTLSQLGTGKRVELDRTPDRALTPNHGHTSAEISRTSSPLHIGAGEIAAAPPTDTDSAPAPAPSQAAPNGPAPTLVAPKPKLGVVVPLENEASPKPDMPKLQRISTNVRHEMEESAKSDGLKDGDFRLADALARTHLTPSPRPASDKAGGKSAHTFHSKLDDQLGPWRFADPGTDMVEDNAFIFTTHSLPVPKRRKHFAAPKNREEFHYDPDVVYAASFFTDAMDFNTFQLGIGPVKINVARFFTDMPVQYTLRNTKDENITYATVSFQLVD